MTGRANTYFWTKSDTGEGERERSQVEKRAKVTSNLSSVFLLSYLNNIQNRKSNLMMSNSL
jgi:hypothetical protein